MANKYIEGITQKVLKKEVRLILPEQNDPRVIAAQSRLISMGINLINMNNYDDSALYINHIKNKKFANNWTDDMLETYVSIPLNKALILLDLDCADCLVAGATISSADVIKSSIRIIGLNKQTQWISSCFFLINPNGLSAYTYADCGVIPEPNIKQLVSIAYNAAMTHKLLAQEQPKIAFLSFSTNGSAEHYTIKKMKNAVSTFSKKYPDILCEGETQFDAAINESVSKKKNKNSLLNGQANVFIFPDLNAANIAYKITQYLARYSAWGPLLQGLNKPVHDLSRGCTIDDIVHISLVAALESETNSKKD